MKHWKYGGRVSAACLAMMMLWTAMPTAMAVEGTVNTNKLVLRESASKKSKALQTIEKGDSVEIKSSTGDWYKVTYGKYTGYVMKKYVKASGKVEEKSSSDKTKNETNTTASSSDDSGMKGIKSIKDIGSAPATVRPGDRGGDVRKVQQALKLLGYYKGKIDGIAGDGTTDAIKAFQKKYRLSQDGIAGKVTIETLFDQKAADDTGKTTTTQPVTATTDNGMNGISSIKDIGSAPGTVRPGDRGDDVRKVQQALKLLGYYSGKIDGIAGDGTTKAIKAFQKKHKLSQDGIAGKVTIKSMFDQKAADDNTPTTNTKITTESLDWFGHENTIPKGAKVTIKDCKTGKTFEAKRWSGANHMDTEPASPEDTAIMKSIYGGEWSWNRRAILVQYNGHVYAASMNGMPHGTSNIDNDFDGHFCVHFTGSKTHETNKVDDDHQDAVKTALKYTW